MTLEDAAAMSRDRNGFRIFLLALADSFEENPQDWENVSLESYFRAWSAWIGDMDGYFENRAESPPADLSWKLLAQMLLAAKVYE